MITADKDQLYLSRLRLDPQKRVVWQCMSNSQRIHALLMRGFPIGDRSEHNVLFRLDPVKGSREGLIDVIVQSTIEPDWAYLRREGLLLHESEFFGDGLVKNISSLPDRLQVGDVFRFRLRANPTKRIPWDRFKEVFPEKAERIIANRIRDHGFVDERKLETPRISVTDHSLEKTLWLREHPGDEFRPERSAEDKLLEWLQRKGELNGFQVARVDSRPDPLLGDMQLGLKTTEDGSKMALSHKAIVYEGLLKVTDIDLLRQALRQGIGPAKAYGFGLLSLAPAGGA